MIIFHCAVCGFYHVLVTNLFYSSVSMAMRTFSDGKKAIRKKERKKGKYNVSKSQIICLFFSTFVFMYHLVGIKKLDVQILRLHLIWTLNKLSADGNAFRQCNRSREYCEFLKSEGKLYSFGSSKSDARITSTFFSAFQYILQTIFVIFQSS